MNRTLLHSSEFEAH